VYLTAPPFWNPGFAEAAMQYSTGAVVRGDGPRDKRLGDYDLNLADKAVTAKKQN